MWNSACSPPASMGSQGTLAETLLTSAASQAGSTEPLPPACWAITGTRGAGWTLWEGVDLAAGSLGCVPP